MLSIVWDDAWLTIVRLAVLTATGWAMQTIYRMLKRPKSTKSAETITLIPRSILYFTFAWLALTFFFSVALITGDLPAVEGAARTMYGASLAWSIFGLAWILSIGSRGSIAALDVLSKLREHAKDLSTDGEDAE